MKKLLILVIVSFLLVGCLTTEPVKEKSVEVYNPSVNVFEDRSWISYEPLELFQDDEYLYFHLKYTSDSDGMFSLFNPPDGKKFMVKGKLDNGSGQIIEKVLKSDLEGIEGVTILLFPGDYSNESDRTGFFFKSEQIKWGLIPSIYDGLISVLEEKIENGKTVEVVKEDPVKEVEITTELKIMSDNSVIDANFGDSIDYVMEAMSGKTLLKVWYGATKFELDERPNKAFYTYDGISYFISNGRLFEITITSREYALSNGLTYGDTLEQIETIMGPDFSSESNGIKTFVNYENPYVSFEVGDDTNTIWEIGLRQN